MATHRMTVRCCDLAKTSSSSQLGRTSFIAPVVADVLAHRRLMSDFRRTRPAPMPLPAAQEKEMQDLIKERMTAGPFAEVSQRETAKAKVMAGNARGAGSSSSTSPSAGKVDVEKEMHPDLRKKPKPEFEGDRNPQTGEIGGPRYNPLRHQEWTYGGRATDF